MTSSVDSIAEEYINNCLVCEWWLSSERLVHVHDRFVSSKLPKLSLEMGSCTSREEWYIFFSRRYIKRYHQSSQPHNHRMRPLRISVALKFWCKSTWIYACLLFAIWHIISTEVRVERVPIRSIISLAKYLWYYPSEGYSLSRSDCIAMQRRWD